MDTEALLSRNPKIALVDELAHTNAPGSVRGTRWQDVAVLRESGIDVISTLNIQHLESLQDIVAGITGVRVRETIPDWILDGAAEALIERLERDKVYPSARARQALEHFFRVGNLTALRELALRRTAAGVDARLEDYMRAHEIEAVWPAAELLLVLVDTHPQAGSVVRHDWRLASAPRGELIAIAFVPLGWPATLPARERAALEPHLRLAEDLGAEIRLVEGPERAPALARAVRDEHATVQVLGHTPARRWQRLRQPSLADQLRHLVDGVGIHLVEVKPHSE